MKTPEEQIAEIIDRARTHPSNLSDTVYANIIFSEVTVERECPECKGLTYDDPHDADNYCTKCQGTGKVEITLKELIEGGKR